MPSGYDLHERGSADQRRDALARLLWERRLRRDALARLLIGVGKA